MMPKHESLSDDCWVFSAHPPSSPPPHRSPQTATPHHHHHQPHPTLPLLSVFVFSLKRASSALQCATTLIRTRRCFTGRDPATACNENVFANLLLSGERMEGCFMLLEEKASSPVRGGGKRKAIERERDGERKTKNREGAGMFIPLWH